MNKEQPISDQATHYRMEVRGRVNREWLRSFDSSAEVNVDVDEVKRTEDVTVLNAHTDQAGIVGLVRRLHGLGMTILLLRIVSK